MSAATTVRNFDDGSATFSDDGGNSTTLAKMMGTYSISDLHPNGREAVVVQVQGAYVGDRQGDRVPAKISISAKVARFDEDAYRIMDGSIAGYVSTTLDIGDGKRFNLTISESYSTDSRSWTFDDCRAVGSYTQGQPAEVSIDIECIGAVTRDGVTIVAGR
jgi:hypothetical protein|tara:strand:+ start:996 stop:1478 length:483 start_codon:yes stop_codon:yes gene_type:complete